MCEGLGQRVLDTQLPGSEVSRKGSPLQDVIAGTQSPDMVTCVLQLE